MWPLAVKALIAVAAVAICGWLLTCTLTNRWPMFLFVKNDTEDARCSFAFSDGFTWNADFRSGEEKFWLFLFGEPYAMQGTCPTATESIRVGYAWCSRMEPVFTHSISFPSKPGNYICITPEIW